VTATDEEEQHGERVGARLLSEPFSSRPVGRQRCRGSFAAVVSCPSTQTTASRREEEQIAAEAAFDGIYVMRTSVPGAELKAPDVVRAYKQLKDVERVFRTLKGRLELRPIHHRLEQRVKAHVFLCLLSDYLAWHLREDWKPLLFDDEPPPTQPDPVAKASRSTAAQRKTQTKRTTAGEPCHSARRALDPRPKHDPPAGHRRQLRAAHTTHTHPGPSSS
jgi:Transposase DDE domain